MILGSLFGGNKKPKPKSCRHEQARNRLTKQLDRLDSEELENPGQAQEHFRSVDKALSENAIRNLFKK